MKLHRIPRFALKVASNSLQRVPGNTWEAKAYGQCSREKTADGSFANTGKGERVR